MDKPKTYNEWHSSLKDFEGLRHANCCKISYEAGQQSRQAEVDEQHKINVALNSENIKQREQILYFMKKSAGKQKRITELEKSEFALAKVKQILNKRIKTRLLESIIVRELIDFLFSDKERGNNANS